MSMKKEWPKEVGRWHGVVIGGGSHGFSPHPQNSFNSMKIIMKINGGGYIYHRNFPKLAIRV